MSKIVFFCLWNHVEVALVVLLIWIIAWFIFIIRHSIESSILAFFRFLSILCKEGFSFLLSYFSGFSSFLLSLSLFISLAFCSLSDCILKIAGSHPVHHRIFICETGLSHIKCFLHSHCEGDTKGKYKTKKNQNYVNKIYLMCNAPWWANEGKILEMRKAIINKNKKSRSKYEISQIYRNPSHWINKFITEF